MGIARERLSVLLAIAAAAGCASKPHVYEYKHKLGLTLVCADPGSVDTSCRNDKGETVSDLGQVVPRRVVTGPDKNGFLNLVVVQIPACWKRSARELWMRWGEFCETLAHEFCHIDEELSPADCARRFP